MVGNQGHNAGLQILTLQEQYHHQAPLLIPFHRVPGITRKEKEYKRFGQEFEDWDRLWRLNRLAPRPESLPKNYKFLPIPMISFCHILYTPMALG